MRQSRSVTMFVVVCLCVALVSVAGCGKAKETGPELAGEIRLLDWPEDMPQAVLDGFQKEFGVRVEYVTYETGEEAVERIAAGEVFDVAVFDSYLVDVLIRRGLLAALDYRNIPNFKNVSPNFRDLAYDPDNVYSVPFNWGWSGMVYRPDLVPEPLTQWSDLWRLDGVRIGLRADPRDSLGMALRSLGYSANTEDAAQLAQAQERLLELKDRVQLVGGWGEDSAPLLASGEIAVLVGWPEDVLTLRDTGSPAGWALPKDGVLLWSDAFVIPKNSPNRLTAETFLNYLLRPEVAGAITNENYYPIANSEAAAFYSSEVRDDAAINPSAEAILCGEYLLPLSHDADARYADLWAQFVAALPGTDDAN